MEEHYTRIKRILVKLTEMCQANKQEVLEAKNMTEDFSQSLMQLNLLVLELSKNTEKTIRALTKRIIDLEMSVGIEKEE